MTAGPAWQFLLRSATPKVAAAAGVAAAAAVVTTSSSTFNINTDVTSRRRKNFFGGFSTVSVVDCEGSKTSPHTVRSPPLLLIGLHGQPLEKNELIQLQQKSKMRRKSLQQSMEDKSSSSSSSSSFPSSSFRVIQTPFPQIYHMSLAQRLQSMLPGSIQDQQQESSSSSSSSSPSSILELSSGGQLGQSGVIPKDRASELLMNEYFYQGRPQPGDKEPTESVLVMKVEGEVDPVAAWIELCDEAADLQHELQQQSSATMNERRRTKSKAILWWQKLLQWIHSLYYLSIGSIQALGWWITTTTMTMGNSQKETNNNNPFQTLLEFLKDSEIEKRTTPEERCVVSWAPVASIDEMEHIITSFTTKNNNNDKTTKSPLTIQEVMVSCVSAAVARQIQEHQMEYELQHSNNTSLLEVPATNNTPTKYNNNINNKSISVMIHKDKKERSDESDNNNFVASIPTDSKWIASERLRNVHQSLNHSKELQSRIPPPAVLFWKRIFQKFQSSSKNRDTTSNSAASAAFQLIQFQGPSRRIHLGGRPVEVIQGFLPPTNETTNHNDRNKKNTTNDGNLPIGVVISTYAGQVHVSITAQRWAVPDAEQFLSWVLDEYKFLYTESPVVVEDVPAAVATTTIGLQPTIPLS